MKYQHPTERLRLFQSPSIRREWIEMQFSQYKTGVSVVSLHTEGVD